MADRFYRLITFVVDICTPVLKELLVKCAKADTKLKYKTFDAYMLSRKHDISKLKTVRKEQLHNMYPSAGKFVEGALDVTLLATLLLNLFGATLQSIDVHDIETIRDTRNSFQHKSCTDSVDQNEFVTKWAILKTSVLSISNRVGGPSYECTITSQIQSTMTNNLPNLGDSLRIWYMSLHFDLKAHFETQSKELTAVNAELVSVNTKLTTANTELVSIKTELTTVNEELASLKSGQITIQDGVHSIEKLSQVAETKSSDAAKMMSKVVQKRTNREGSIYKRVKTVDRRADQIKENFQITVRNNRDDDLLFSNIDEILKLMESKHRVVITGTRVSSCLQVAIKVIDNIGYNMVECVEVTNKDEWNSVEPTEASLVLCKYPFGHLSFDEQKARRMFEAFDRMLISTKESTNDRIDIIIVSQREIMSEAIRVVNSGESHELLDAPVDVDRTCVVNTFENNTDVQVHDVSMNHDRKFQDLLGLTQAYIESWKCVSVPYANALIKELTERLRRGKCIVLTGERGCGKTTVAMTMASMYSEKRCLRLTEPKDIKLIHGDRTSLVIVEDFAGKYKLDETDINKWLKAFDILFPLAQKEDFDVIMTCGNKQLESCKREFPSHRIFHQLVQIPNLTVMIKEKLTDTEDATLSEVDLRGPDVQQPVSLTLQCRIALKEAGEEKEPYYIGLAFLPDNRLFVVDSSNQKCHVLNTDLGKLGLPYCFTSYPCNVCILSGDRVAVTTGTKQIQILHVSNSNEITHVKTLKTLCEYDSISPISESLFAMSTYDYSRPARIVRLTGEKCEESDFTDISLPNKKYAKDRSRCTYIQGTSTLVLTDKFDSTVYMYTRNNKTTCVVRDDRIREARGVCVGPGNSIFVCSTYTNTIVHIASTGRIIDCYPVDMIHPLEVCVSSDGKKLAVSSSNDGKRCLQMYNIVT